MKQVYLDIASKRRYQDKLWGKVFDDNNTINDWVTYITRYASMAAVADDSDDVRRRLIDVAALAVAAIEALERNGSMPPRHYDLEVDLEEATL